MWLNRNICSNLHQLQEHRYASQNRLVSFALLTVRARKDDKYTININTNILSNRRNIIFHLPNETGLTLRIIVAISFTKTEWEVFSWTSIISLHPHSILCCTYSAEVFCSSCSSGATGYRLVAKPVNVKVKAKLRGRKMSNSQIIISNIIIMNESQQ